MGLNKALIPFQGVSLVERVFSRVHSLSDDIYVTARQPRDFPNLGVPVYQDSEDISGSLIGLLTALQHARYETLVVIACDMPFVVPALVDALAVALQSGLADVAIPRTPNGLEPLLAAYRVPVCLPAVEQALHSGSMRMISWLDAVKTLEMDETVLRRHDPLLQSFININTPEELRQALLLADQLT